jgi:hypothetical protein
MKTIRFRLVVDGVCDAEDEPTVGRLLHDRLSEFVDDGGLDRGDAVVHELREVEITTDAKLDAPETLLKAITAARETLQAAYPGIQAERDPKVSAVTSPGRELRRVGHLLWMCGEIQAYLDTDQRERAMRWLGFVQGSLWLMDLRSIDEMREDGRG